MINKIDFNLWTNNPQKRAAYYYLTNIDYIAYPDKITYDEIIRILSSFKDYTSNELIKHFKDHYDEAVENKTEFKTFIRGFIMLALEKDL